MATIVNPHLSLSYNEPNVTLTVTYTIDFGAETASPVPQQYDEYIMIAGMDIKEPLTPTFSTDSYYFAVYDDSGKLIGYERGFFPRQIIKPTGSKHLVESTYTTSRKELIEDPKGLSEIACYIMLVDNVNKQDLRALTNVENLLLPIPDFDQFNERQKKWSAPPEKR